MFCLDPVQRTGLIHDNEQPICVTSIYYHQNMRNLENTKISLFKFLNKKHDIASHE